MSFGGPKLVPHGPRTVVLDHVGSTNTEAFARAQAGEAGPLWIVARRQTAGRGRLDRHWASEPGNLYASLLQRFACPQMVVHQLALVAGVAVIDAIRAAAARLRLDRLRLKWPNDVLIGEAKCAGILAESQSYGADWEITAVIGIGINLAWHPDDLGRTATHLAAHGANVSPEAMFVHLDAALQHWLEVWAAGAGFSHVRGAWLARGGRVGESIMVDTGTEKIAGTFLDLDADGALIVRDNRGMQRRLTFGDVTLSASSSEQR